MTGREVVRVRRSPQEKKALSYARDRRNAYGESDKASRRIVPLRKAKVNRANRHADQQQLVVATGPVDATLAEQSELRVAGRRPASWRKWRDEPLGERVRRQLARREHYEQVGGRRGPQSAAVDATPAAEKVLAHAWVTVEGPRPNRTVRLTETALVLSRGWQYSPLRLPLDKVASVSIGAVSTTVIMFTGERQVMGIDAGDPLVRRLEALMGRPGRRHPWWVDPATFDALGDHDQNSDRPPASAD